MRLSNGSFAYYTAVCVAAVGIGAAISSNPELAIAGLSVAILAVLFVMPVDILLRLSLWTFILVPVAYMSLPIIVSRYLSPAVAVVLVASVKALTEARPIEFRPSGLRLAVLGSLVIFVGVSFLSTTDPSRSTLWLISVVICVLGALVLAPSLGPEFWPTARRTYMWIGVLLGAVAAAEFFFSVNPWTDILSAAYSAREWGVFRTKTTLGHPLFTSLVSVTCLMIAFFHGDLKRTRLDYCAIVGATTAVILSVSRTGLLALSAGVAVGLATLGYSAHRRRTGQKWSVLNLIALIGIGVVVSFSPLLAKRSGSSGGVGSADYRVSVLSEAQGLIDENKVFGVGPGASSRYFSEKTGLILENSWLQLALSLGLVAAAAIVFCAVALVLSAIRQGRPDVAAALAAVIVSVGGFSVVDNNPAFLVFFTPMVAILFNRQSPTDQGNAARHTKEAGSQPDSQLSLQVKIRKAP